MKMTKEIFESNINKIRADLAKGNSVFIIAVHNYDANRTFTSVCGTQEELEALYICLCNHITNKTEEAQDITPINTNN